MKTAGSRAGLAPFELLLALIVVAIWGTNFVVAHEGLREFPPLTFGALRFLLASLPLLLFIPRPRMPIKLVAAYGLLIGAGQFGMLFYALTGHISPGLASLLVQTQAFFTIGLAVVLAGESICPRNLLALGVCSAGVALIAVNTGREADWLGVLLVLGAALGWAGGNLVVKRAGAVDMLALVVWSSLFATSALLATALALEGPVAIAESIAGATATGWAALVWQAVGNSLFGYAVWNWLLSRHPAALVAPLAILVPIFGMSASSWYLAEPMPAWKIAAAMLVLAGLAINIGRPGRQRGTVAAQDDVTSRLGQRID